MADIGSIDIKVDGFEEYEYLCWFRINADFGPAHDDVIAAMNEAYESETGNKVPQEWIGEE